MIADFLAVHLLGFRGWFELVYGCTSSFRQKKSLETQGKPVRAKKNFATKVYKPAQRLYVLKRDLGAKTNKNWYNIN